MLPYSLLFKIDSDFPYLLTAPTDGRGCFFIIFFREKTYGRKAIAWNFPILYPPQTQGNIASSGSATFALLKPVYGKTGTSETVISRLADETKVSYADLLKLSAYLNVHLADFGPESSVILAAGNIGTRGNENSINSRIGLCTQQ
jgi:hypothetical protein